MRFSSVSLGFKLNFALLIFILVLGIATSAIVLYGFNRTQRDATVRSQEALEEQGKLALKALAGGVADSGVLQFEAAGAVGQRAGRYMQDFRASGATPIYDTSRFVQTEDGIWYDPDPSRISDTIVVNHGQLQGSVLDDIAYSAALDPILPALTQPYPGEISGDAYRPIAIIFVGMNGVGRSYPAIGIQDTTPAEVDVSSIYDRFGPQANPERVTVWTAPYEDRLGRGLVMTAQTPVYEGDTFRGIIEVDLSIAQLVALVNQIKPTPGGFTFYVDTDGEIMKTEAFELVKRGAQEDPQLAAVLEAMRASPPEPGVFVETVTLNGEEYFVAHTSMPLPGGAIAVAAPVDEVTAQAAAITAGIDEEGDRTFIIMLVAMAVLFAAGLTGATFLNRTLLLSPLRRLFAGTRAVAAGDLSTRVDLDRGDELGMLANSFNKMVDQLRESERHLERQVEEQTRELTALLEVSRTVTSTLDLQELFRVILDQLHGILDHSGSSVLVREGDDLVIKAARAADGADRELGARIPVTEKSALQRTIFAQEPVIIADIRGDGALAESYRSTIDALGLLGLPPFSEIRSWMALPLVAGNEVIGMLTMSRTTPDYFTEEHASMVAAFANQVSLAIHNARLFTETRSRSEELSALFEVSQALTSTLEVRPLLELILDQIRRVVPYEGAGAALLVDGGVRQMAVRRPAGYDRMEPGSSIQQPEQFYGRGLSRLQGGESIIIADVRGDSADALDYRRVQGGTLEGTPVEYARSVLAVPLMVRDRMIGSLVMASSQAGFYTPAHRSLVETVAAPAATAIENARLFEQAEARTRELRALLEVSRAVSSTLDLGEVLGTILDQLGAITEHTGASILLFREDALEFVDARSMTGTTAPQGARIPFSAAPYLTALLQGGETVIIDDIRSDDRLAADYRAAIASIGMPDRLPFDVIRSWMAVPLALKERILGILTISWTAPGHFTAEHARLARAFADQAAAAIENARLFVQTGQVAALEERQRLARELHDSVSQALYGIALGARTARTILDREPEKAIEPVDYVLSLAEAGLAEMRALILELRPESLETEGLVAALEKQIAAARARYGLEITALLREEPDIPIDRKEALYRITQEALHNVVKHANATSVGIRLAADSGHLSLSISDNGRGFDPGVEYPGHLGLRSMRERAEKMGAEFRVDSNPGEGTTVIVRLPIRQRGRS